MGVHVTANQLVKLGTELFIRPLLSRLEPAAGNGLVMLTP